MIHTRTAAGEAGNRFDSEELRGQQSGNNARKSWDDPRPVHDDELPGEFELSPLDFSTGRRVVPFLLAGNESER